MRVMPGPSMTGPPQVGTVVDFDEARGLGFVAGVDGIRFAFHCVSIADGSRSIRSGTSVSFTTRPKLGRVEAVDIREMVR